MKTCKHEGCTNPVFSTGYCKYHQSKRTDPKYQKQQQILQRTPIRKESDKMHTARLQYAKLRKVFLEKHPTCEIPVNGCTGVATEVHHMAGRGKHLLDESSWKAACHSCHVWTTEHTHQSIEMGYSLSRLNKSA